jgi:hypothetical protein
MEDRGLVTRLKNRSYLISTFRTHREERHTAFLRSTWRSENRGVGGFWLLDTHFALTEEFLDVSGLSLAFTV